MTIAETEVQRERERDGSARAFVRPHAVALALGTGLLTSFVFCYADVFRILWIQWNTNEANSHGLLIPSIALYLLWARRDRILRVRPRPVWWAGLPLILISLAVLLAGRLVGIVGLQEVSMVGTLWGLALLLLGWQGLRALWFPVAYLLFMMPIWDLATEPMYYPLQLFAARGAGAILTTVGIPVFRDGTTLQLPNTSVEVAFACSGINFLMSVLAIGTVFAYTATRNNFRRVLILGTALTVALLSNPLRVALIVYSFYSGLASPRQSHMWQGMVVAVGAFALLFLLAPRLGGGAGEEPRRGGWEPSPGRRVSWPLMLALTVISCLLLGVGGHARPLEWPTPSLASLKLDSVPYQVGEWRATPGERPAPPPAGVVLSDELWREYRHPDGRSVRVYVGRYRHDGGRAGESAYFTDYLDGIQDFRVQRTGGKTVPAKIGIMGPRGGRVSVAYWFELGSVSTSDRVVSKLFGAWSAGLRRDPGPVVVGIFGDSAGLRDQRWLAEFVAAMDAAVRGGA